MTRLISVLALTILTVSPTGAQFRYQTDFSAEDFRARREKIDDEIGDNLAIIQGAEDVQPPLL